MGIASSPLSREVTTAIATADASTSPGNGRDPVRLAPFARPERPWRRLAFAAVALALTFLYFQMLHGFWAPASPLIDQNAYEMGGKQFARSFTTGVKPANDFVYVSAMYVRAADGTYYPKYPLGMSMLYACALWTGQWAGVRHAGMEWAFLLAPASAAASVLGLYLFLRRIASGFASILGALLLGFSPLALVLVNQHWSHHPAMAVAVWGMFFLLAWWQQNGWWRGVAAGLLLGFAVLIRYTEGLLLLPLAFVVLSKLPYRARGDVPALALTAWAVIAAVGLGCALSSRSGAIVWLAAGSAAVVFVLATFAARRYRASAMTFGWPATVVAAVLLVALIAVGSSALPVQIIGGTAGVVVVKTMLATAACLLLTVRWSAWRILIQVAWPLAGWLLPVLYLVVFNKTRMGSWTGYDTTNESTGFTWQQLAENWEYIFKQLNGTVIFFYMPLALLGLGMLFRRNWRLATLMVLWLVPNLITYGCYYWGVNLPAALVPVLFYFRFFLTCLPPVGACAALLLDDLLHRDRRRSYLVRRGRGRREAWGAAVAVGVGVISGVVVHAVGPELRGDVALLIGTLAALGVAMLFAAGRGVAGPVTAGAVVAFAAGVSLYDNRGALERDFVINANLFDLARNVLDRIPAADMKKSPLLFTEDFGPINHLQFAGDFECYTKDAFTIRPTRRPNRADSNKPDPEQNVRREHTAAVYQGKTDADLVKLQNDVMANALKDGRRVFVVLQPPALARFVGTFVTPTRFKVKTTWKWREPAEMSDEGRKAMASFGLAGRLLMGTGIPQTWAMAEVVLK